MSLPDERPREPGEDEQPPKVPWDDPNAEALRRAVIQRLGEADDELRQLWRHIDDRLDAIMRRVGEAQRALIFDDVDEITDD